MRRESVHKSKGVKVVEEVEEVEEVEVMLCVVVNSCNRWMFNTLR